jgi:hypothetical protein
MDTAKRLRHRDKVASAAFDLVVVDEAHRLKNQKTLAWKFLDRLAPRYLLLLTATPVQNDLHELYNLVQLLRPGLLGTYRTFGREFMRRGDRRMPQNTGRLATLLGETMIRTTRASTSIRFPKREVTNVHFDLSLPEREIYDDVTRLVRRLLQGQREAKRGAIKLTLLTLQKEIGSSSFAAIPTLGKLLARERRTNTAEVRVPFPKQAGAERQAEARPRGAPAHYERPARRARQNPIGQSLRPARENGRIAGKATFLPPGRQSRRTASRCARSRGAPRGRTAPARRCARDIRFQFSRPHSRR